jgi:multidrug efflux system membrane fusion protein
MLYGYSRGWHHAGARPKHHTHHIPGTSSMPPRDPYRLHRGSAAGSLALVSALLLSGCSKHEAMRSPRVSVSVAKVETRTMPIALIATGTVEPIQSANVGSQVGGTIQRIDFREGQEVEAGQPLFELDSRPFRATLAQAMGQLARDRAQATAARLAADRTAKLFQQNLTSQADWDAAQATADALAAAMQTDSAIVSKARLDLEFSTIRSPISGRTGRFNKRVGDYVAAASSEPLVTVNQMRPIYARFTVSESDRPIVERYRHASPSVFVRPSSSDSTEVAGRLVFVDNAIDPATGTLTLKGEFPNADRRLWPGEFVEVRLVLAMQKDATVVPFPAVSNGQQGTYVYVLNADSTASMRPVAVQRSDDAIAVISSGLSPGETVVTDGQFRISPGAKLVVRNLNSAGATRTGRSARGSTRP